MRHLYLIALAGLLTGHAAAQTVAEADSTRDEALPTVAAEVQFVRSQVDSTGECTEILQRPGRAGLVRVFHPSGRLKHYIPYADLTTAQQHGVVTSWYDNGQLATQQTFIRGQREGALLLYYPTGQLRRQTEYEAGTERLGACYDSTGAPTAYFPYEQPPLYPGGHLQLIKEVKWALRKWRPTGLVQLIRAQIHVSLQVKEDGSVGNPKVSLIDESFALLPMPGGQIDHKAWRAAMEQFANPLVSKVQQALTQLDKPFNPGQRDGSTVSWQYTFTIPLDYGADLPSAGGVRRRSATFRP